MIVNWFFFKALIRNPIRVDLTNSNWFKEITSKVLLVQLWLSGAHAQYLKVPVKMQTWKSQWCSPGSTLAVLAQAILMQHNLVNIVPVGSETNQESTQKLPEPSKRNKMVIWVVSCWWEGGIEYLSQNKLQVKLMGLLMDLMFNLRKRHQGWHQVSVGGNRRSGIFISQDGGAWEGKNQASRGIPGGRR